MISFNAGKRQCIKFSPDVKSLESVLSYFTSTHRLSSMRVESCSHLGIIVSDSLALACRRSQHNGQVDSVSCTFVKLDTVITYVGL